VTDLFTRRSSVSGGRCITLTALAFTIVITRVFNSTRASLPIAILVHSSIRAFSVTLGAIFPARAMASAFPLMIFVTRGRSTTNGWKGQDPRLV